MRNKNKKSTSFFTSLLGVLLGISLTFGVNALWQRHEEKKRTREILILVRNELEGNKKWFKYQETLLKKEADAYIKLLNADNNWATIPEDSLLVYINQVGQLEPPHLTTSAWQIFQNSEMIQKISNKELVISIIDSYYFINYVYDFLMNNYWSIKLKAFPFEETYEKIHNDDIYGFADVMMSNKEIIQFIHMALSSTNFYENQFFIVDGLIDFTITLLDNYGNFKYNMEDKDKEFESFFEARRDSVRNFKIESLRQKNDTIENNINNK